MSDIYEVIKSRHSVRSYTNKKIEGKTKDELEKIIEECNKEGNLDIKLVLNEPEAINPNYGTFKNVKNYIVLCGKIDKDLEKKCGYYGEKIVLKAQELGLNTCWIGLTYDKNKIPFKIPAEERLIIVISVGYGENNGVSHKTKTLDKVSKTTENLPDWYKKGIEYALLAPTAINQQKFKFKLIGENEVKATTSFGFFAKVDLGIAKYHFELGAGKENFKWAE